METSVDDEDEEDENSSKKRDGGAVDGGGRVAQQVNLLEHAPLSGANILKEQEKKRQGEVEVGKMARPAQL